MVRVKFQPLKYRRTSEIIEDSIKDLILTQSLKPGDRLPTEKEISRQFRVSIVTVREALRGLEAFGVIKKKRGRDGGIFVTAASDQAMKSAMILALTPKKFSVSDVNEVRIWLQRWIARLAAAKINGDMVKEIENNIKHCERIIAKKSINISRLDFTDIEEGNSEFHRLIGAATGNPVLALTVEYVEDFFQIFRKGHLIDDLEFTVSSIQAHRKIYECLKNHDADGAEREMVSHCEAVKAYQLSRKIGNVP